MFLAIVAVLAGLVLLTFAADQFVLGGARLATNLSMSPVVIGAVVLGFGTSAPELLVSGIAASRGELALGVGNVVGSNAANLSLVLGAAALISPLPLPANTISREAPLAVGSAMVFAVLVQGGLNRFEGIAMLVLLAAAILWLLTSGDEEGDIDEEFLDTRNTTGYEIGRTMVGLVGTVGGAQLLVWGALVIAEEIGLSGGFVGLTMVAIGTSLPELVTAIAGARRGETELIVGNLLGSNLFNSLAVGGTIAVVGPGMVGDNSVAVTGVILMLMVSVTAVVFMYTRRLVVRWEAGVLLAMYVATLSIVGVAG
ncbi:MAG: calcium/sodium antiporter [Acidimicrobiales bacterium]